MRIGVIRGDMPGPIFLADVETVSQFNPPTEPPGQCRYISRPDPEKVAQVIASFGLPGPLPAAADVITACLPVGGPLDVSAATIRGVVSALLKDAQVTAVADVIAPRIIETEVAKRSFQVGMISKYLGLTYNPDPRHLPAYPQGPAIAVVQDDGVSAMALPLPSIAAAALGVPDPGTVTITGQGLGSSEIEATTVKFTGGVNKSIPQAAIVHAGGMVSDTTIVVPAALIPGAATGTVIQVRMDSLVSNAFVL